MPRPNAKVVAAVVAVVLAAGAVVAGPWHPWATRTAHGPATSSGPQAAPGGTGDVTARTAPARPSPRGAGSAHPPTPRGAAPIPLRSPGAPQAPAHQRAAGTAPQVSPGAQPQSRSGWPQSTAVYPSAPYRPVAAPQTAPRAAAVRVRQAAPRAVTGAVSIHMTFRREWHPLRLEVGPASTPPPVTFVCPSCPPSAATTRDYSSAKPAHPSGSATTSSY